MHRRFHLRSRSGVVALMCLAVAFAAWVLSGGQAKQSQWNGASEAAGRRAAGYPQLISVEPLPAMDGATCEWMPASASSTLVAALQQRAAGSAPPAPDPASRAEVTARAPLRVIKDPYSAFSSVAVDPIRNEVVLTDESLFNIMVYDRMENTPPNAAMSEPKRMIGGLNTKIEFQCGLYIDPASGDIYAVNNDTVNTLVIFDRQAKGNVPPTRELATPHGTFGITVDEEHLELFLTIQHDSAVVVYRKMAEGDEAPIRLLQGDHTLLADPHGIALDTKNDLIFVTNHGSVHQVRADSGSASGRGGRKEGKANWPLNRDRAVPGTGRILPSSITVYSRNASGDTAPLRIIQGPQTQLNWPSGIAIDPERGELFVANDAGDSILVFSASASGDVAPLRVLKGPKSLIKNPTGVYLDLTNDELWVSNFGNHTATVYKRTASGDTAPLRVIRSAPLDKPALMIGNPGAVAYDSNREEILVPN
ncbi:MAG: hypothetical protein IH935_09385 [Acidobacteria bacterium]|nr:hypothetical protein [Acidobacteriota bacterium]